MDRVGFYLRRADERDIATAKAELDAAIEADRNQRKFPPMKTMAWLLSSGFLPKAEQTLLADFIAGEHRGKKGIKENCGELRNIDINRALDFSEYIQEGMSRSDAIEAIIKDEQTEDANSQKNVRSIERAIERGIKYMTEDNDNLQRETEIKILELKHLKEQAERFERLRPFMKDHTGT